jgi:SAM-dependent methyltransferase
VDENGSSSPAEIYERYLGPAIAEPFTRLLLKRAAPRRGQRVLDLACGTGVVARHVAPLVGVEGKVVAVDISSAMLAVGRALPAPVGTEIAWRQGDAIALDLPDGAFDLVLCQQGLQFFSDRLSALSEMRRVLARDGRVVLSVWRSLEHHPVYEALFRAIARRFGLSLSALDVSFSLGDAEELRTLLVDAGFRRSEIEVCALDVRVPAPARFVQITVQGATTSIPAFMKLRPAERSAIIETTSRELASLIDRYSRDRMLEFQMSTHISTAS